MIHKSTMRGNGSNWVTLKLNLLFQIKIQTFYLVVGKIQGFQVRNLGNQFSKVIKLVDTIVTQVQTCQLMKISKHVLNVITQLQTNSFQNDQNILSLNFQKLRIIITSGIFSSMILMTASMFVFLFKITSMFWDTRSVRKNVNILNYYHLFQSRVISSFTIVSGKVYLPGSVRILFKSNACCEPSNRFDMHCCERQINILHNIRTFCSDCLLVHDYSIKANNSAEGSFSVSYFTLRGSNCSGFRSERR